MKPVMLVVGSGPRGVNIGDGMKEYYDLHTLDIDPEVHPDTVGDMRSLPFQDESFEALIAMHCVEHIGMFEVFKTLKEFYRVLKPGGELYITVPNLELICELVLQGKGMQTLYSVGGGYIPITPMDMLYGWGPQLYHGNPFYFHKCAFTREVLFQFLNNEMRWSLIVTNEYRVTGDYDRAELHAYGIKFIEQPTFEPYSQWAKNHNSDCGDPFRLIGGEHLDRYKEKKDE